MRRKHSLEERLLAVQKCLEGRAPNSVAKEMGLPRNDLREWLGYYQRDGVSGLQDRSMKRTNFVEKCEIICEYAEKGVPLHVVSVKYGVSQTAISKWLRIYRAGGYDALRDVKPLGRPKKHKALREIKSQSRPKKMGRPKKQDPQTELERLRYENEYLRAENALLKKVRALMDEREKRLHEIGRKPSKH